MFLLLGAIIWKILSEDFMKLVKRFVIVYVVVAIILLLAIQIASAKTQKEINELSGGYSISEYVPYPSPDTTTSPDYPVGDIIQCNL